MHFYLYLYLYPLQRSPLKEPRNFPGLLEGPASALEIPQISASRASMRQESTLTQKFPDVAASQAPCRGRSMRILIWYINNIVYDIEYMVYGM